MTVSPSGTIKITSVHQQLHRRLLFIYQMQLKWCYLVVSESISSQLYHLFFSSLNETISCSVWTRSKKKIYLILTPPGTRNWLKIIVQNSDACEKIHRSSAANAKREATYPRLKNEFDTQLFAVTKLTHSLILEHPWTFSLPEHWSASLLPKSTT